MNKSIINQLQSQLNEKRRQLEDNNRAWLNKEMTIVERNISDLGINEEISKLEDRLKQLNPQEKLSCI